MTASDVEAACRYLLDNTAAEGRLLFADAPALGSVAMALHQRNMTVGTERPIAVALVEPIATCRPIPVTGDATGQGYDLRTGIAAKLGLALFTDCDQAVPPTVDNWALRYAGLTFTLTDPTDTVLARFNAPEDAQWLAAAERHGKVILIYGPRIGVRRPADIPPNQYNDNARAAELNCSCNDGKVTWGIIRFLLSDDQGPNRKKPTSAERTARK